MKMYAVALAVALAVSGCATRGSNYRPTVDTRGVLPSRLDSDTSECQQYAAQTAGAGEGAAAGAVIGGLLMALLAPKGYRNDWALSGAAVGAAGGAVGANESQETVIRRCLTGRGYSVLY